VTSQTLCEQLQLCFAPPIALTASATAAQRLAAPLHLMVHPAHCARGDLPQKLATQREAVASAKVLLGAEVYHLVATSSMKKGDVLTVRRMLRCMSQCAGVTCAPIVETHVTMCWCDMSLNSTSRCCTYARDGMNCGHSKGG
jgi:MoaC family